MTGRSLLLPLCSGLALAACGKPAPVDTSLAFLNQELADTIVGSPNDRGRRAASGAIGGCPTGDSSGHCGSAATGEVIACGKRYRMSMDWARKRTSGTASLKSITPAATSAEYSPRLWPATTAGLGPPAAIHAR